MSKVKYLVLILLMLIPSVPASNPTITGALTITATPFPVATQYQPYSSAALAATGGVPPYAWSVTTADATLPEGMTIDPSSGAISSESVGGQGGYQFQVQVKDAAGTIATALETINVVADNTYGGCAIFPPDSIFHHRVDSLPVDTSPAAPIPSAYQSSIIRPFFGSDAEPGPNGIPFIRVPFNQPLVSMTWTAYPGESDPSPYPFPANAPIEGSANSGGDMHVLVLQTAGGGKQCQLWETWEASYNGDGTWDAANGAHWDLGTDALRPLSWTSGDAAGLPIMPLTVNYDEVASGAVTHPIRFTLNRMLNGIVWPGRHAAGVGYCSNASGAIPAGSLLSQSSPPTSCTWSGPSGEIYRLKAGVDISVCSSSPESTVILKAMKNYGIILADNGMSGGLIGTPDAHWNNSDLACLRNFTLSEFEPVNVSSLQISADSGATPSGPKPTPPTNLKASASAN